MSDDPRGHEALSDRVSQEDQTLVVDEKLRAVVQELDGDMHIPTREIYDGLIKAARRLRRGRPLDAIG